MDRQQRDDRVVYQGARPVVNGRCSIAAYASAYSIGTRRQAFVTVTGASDHLAPSSARDRLLRTRAATRRRIRRRLHRAEATRRRRLCGRVFGEGPHAQT